MSFAFRTGPLSWRYEPKEAGLPSFEARRRDEVIRIIDLANGHPPLSDAADVVLAKVFYLWPDAADGAVPIVMQDADGGWRALQIQAGRLVTFIAIDATTEDAAAAAAKSGSRA